MSASCIDDITITYDSNDISFTMPQGSITVPLDLNVPFDWQWQNKTQLDLFDKLIESDWVAASSLFQLEGEDGVIEARDYYIEQKEYLKDCQDHGWLKSTYDDGSQKHHFWFTGSDVDYTWWKMKWSEYFDQSFQLDILD